jgi:RNA polymerase sigma-70 factor, ECF subfamily
VREELSRHRPGLHGFLVRLTGDPVLAEDLAQETFARTLTSNWREEAAPFTWLCAIALNLLRDDARRTTRRREEAVPYEALALLPAVDDIEAAALESEMAACIRDFVFDLPEPQRTMVALYDLGGCEQAEVAAMLGLTPGNARVVLHRGRAALRRRMARECELRFGEAVPCARRVPGASRSFGRDDAAKPSAGRLLQAVS